MAAYTCHNCVYSYCDALLWLRRVRTGEPLPPMCANHPWWPGRMHDVPGVPCRNYRPKPVLPAGDGVRLIPLGDGFYAYVDAADYEWLSQWHWYMNGGYAVRTNKGTLVYMHRQIMHAPRGKLVDHGDGNRANNRRCNLRICNHRENMRNGGKHRDARSRFKGVSYDKRCDKWRAKCSYGGKYHELGGFDLEVDAARAYDRAAVLWFREFARLNFPEEWPPERRAQLYAEHNAARKGESSFARTLVTRHPPEGKKAGRKGRKRKGP